MRTEVVVAVEWRLSWMVVMMVAHKDDGCGYRGGSRGSGWCVATTVVEMKRGGEMRRIQMRLQRRQDTYEIYGRLDDAQDDRLVMNGQLNLLRRDRHSHARTARLMQGEARAVREAWSQSMNASDTTRSETQMVALQSQQRPARDPAHPDVSEEADSSS
ncbi:hypothetical protein Tco_0749809 [Tanacetum coccineum]|uniref:Uncharacterized protein n=1 Tax=Tanacetum coccineum TaxID=301880 RepID=A0ABQ4Z2N3_9ASTR